MKDIKDLIIAKLIESMCHVGGFVPKEYTIECAIDELEFTENCEDCHRLAKELASLKAQIPVIDTTINPNNFECTCGGYPECICEMKKHWKTGDSEYVKSLASDTEAGKQEKYCENCLYKSIPDFQQPCRNCEDSDLWEKETTIYLNECIEKATPNLSKIKDVDQELAEIRGGEDEEITDINFIKWYSGMEESKIRNAFERYKVEILKSKQ